MNHLVMIYIFYTNIQGLGLHLIMFSSMVLCDKPNFADQSDEDTCFCDIGLVPFPLAWLIFFSMETNMNGNGKMTNFGPCSTSIQEVASVHI